MMMRQHDDAIGIRMALEPGKDVPGCCVCCRAPPCCALCGLSPCCQDAQYVVHKREASKYIWIRENSLEWNDPEIVLKNGSCFGVDPCEYDLQDRVVVLYFDDPRFDQITNKTRCCNEARTCICGGKGERMLINAPCFLGCCYRASYPCPFVPGCCPLSCCPCVSTHEIWTADAQKGLYEIKKARAAEMTDKRYND
jgi:hypothetical protein